MGFFFFLPFSLTRATGKIVRDATTTIFFSLGHVPPPPRQRYLICKATDRYRQAQKEPSTHIFSSFSLSAAAFFLRFKKSRRRDAAAAAGEKKRADKEKLDDDVKEISKEHQCR